MKIWGIIRRLRSLLMLEAVGLLVAALNGCQPSQASAETIVLYGNWLKSSVINMFKHQ